jgi:signal transduction histidine kinase
MYYFEFLEPGIKGLLITNEFKLIFIFILLISLLYNALLVSIFNIQLDSFLTFFNKIIRREKLKEEDLETYKDFKDKFLILESQLESYDLATEHKVKVQAQIELSKQLAHDIRSPLAAINTVLEDSQEINKLILINSVKRINEISNKLLNETQDNLTKINGNYSLNPLIQEIVQEKLLEYKNKNLKIDFKENGLINAFCEPLELKRVISNLLNNSVEASLNQPVITISINKENDLVIIKISDNGNGIPEFVLQNMGKKAITTKQNGNGLGLNYAIHTIETWGGKLSIESTGASGTNLKIALPMANLDYNSKLNDLNNTRVILIDDDELTRTTWSMKAKKSNISLKTYADIGSFKADIESINKDDILYIDSELGEVKGEELALELRELGFTNLSIASGHPPERFSQYTFLRSVISKKAPF